MEYSGVRGVLLYLAVEGHCCRRLYFSVSFILSVSLSYCYRGQSCEKAREPGDCYAPNSV